MSGCGAAPEAKPIEQIQEETQERQQEEVLLSKEDFEITMSEEDSLGFEKVYITNNSNYIFESAWLITDLPDKGNKLDGHQLSLHDKYDVIMPDETPEGNYNSVKAEANPIELHLWIFTESYKTGALLKERHLNTREVIYNFESEEITITDNIFTIDEFEITSRISDEAFNEIYEYLNK